MSRPWSIAVLGLLSTLAACEGTSSPTPLSPEMAPEMAPRADATTVSPGLADPSGSHGAKVTWDEQYVGFLHYDAARHLMSVHGYIVPLCLGNPVSKEPRMTVETPSQIAQRFVAVRDDEEPVVVYRSDTGAFSCALVASAAVRVATGTVRHTQTFTLASFQSTWNGAVTGPGGSSHHLTEVYQLTADIHDPNNPTQWSLNASEVLIR